MKNKFCWYKNISNKSLVFLLLLTGFLFCENIFAREFRAIIKNDTQEVLKIVDVVKNYSRFDTDYQIENKGELAPTEKTICFSVDICGYLCLEKAKKGAFLSDGFYFTDINNDKIGVVWGEISNTGLTPTFGPCEQENKVFKTEISMEDSSQDPVYIFTIKKIDPKL